MKKIENNKKKRKINSSFISLYFFIFMKIFQSLICHNLFTLFIQIILQIYCKLSLRQLLQLILLNIDLNI